MGVGGEGELGDQQQSAANVLERQVHLAGGIAEHPVVEQLVQQLVGTGRVVLRLDANQRQQALAAAQALQVIKQDNEIDAEFDGLMRKLITYMMEDPRTISASIDLVFVVKAIERVGDHAKNIAEQVIYIVKGADVRHSPLDSVETAVQ